MGRGSASARRVQCAARVPDRASRTIPEAARFGDRVPEHRCRWQAAGGGQAARLCRVHSRERRKRKRLNALQLQIW